VRARAVNSPGTGYLTLWPLLLPLVLFPLHAVAAGSDAFHKNNFGSVGLIDMPSARMAPDGELSVGASFFKNTQHYSFDFQILPWLESSFRYSGLQHLNPQFPVYYDRSFAIKARLWNESGIIPAIAIGANDIIGSGIYGGEYVVASKQIGPLDATLGAGWGRLGSTGLLKNPLSSAFPSFGTRPVITAAGGTDFNTLFHGPGTSLFGGITWHTPIPRLTIIGEYSSDQYTIEKTQGNFSPRSQFNIGASYRVTNGINIGLSWLYGTTIGGSVIFDLNPSEPQYDGKISPAPVEAATRDMDAQQQALRRMLARGKTVAESRPSHSSGDSLVDALWQDNRKFTDVEAHGSTLLLTTSKRVSANDCGDIAREAKGVQFDTIIISNRISGGAQVRCKVPDFDQGRYIPTADLSSVKFDREATRVIDASRNAQTDQAIAIRKMRAGAAKQNIDIQALDFSGSEISVYYTNSYYFSEQDAVDRLTRVLMVDAPTDIEKFRLIAVVNSIPQREFDLLRTPLERNLAQVQTLDISNMTDTLNPPLQNSVLAKADRNKFPKFSWGVFPFFRQELFDPNNPFAVQIGVGVGANVEVWRGLKLTSEIETSLYDDFNTSRSPGSDLPHVRSDFLKYFSQGKTGMGELHADYRFRLAPNVFTIVKAGYLESMFAGAGGEILWRPDGQRWALGGDIYEVWQRNFDRLFGIQAYHATTGHVSLYYASPWYDLNFAVRAGQYLAHDRGLTLEVTRRFSTGVEIGAFATKTNVSASQFGEGSFDKGIIIRIPLGWALPIESQGVLGMDLRPVQRDGGQRLVGDATLYQETRRTSDAEFFQQ
jgi:hypothetical protein